MINVAQAQAKLAECEGEDMVVPKAQFAEMLAEIAKGNAARIRLTNVRSIVNAGAAAAGLTT